MANMNLRRRTAMRGAGGVDWESIARGMVDNTTEFELTDLPAYGSDTHYQFYKRKGLKAVIIPSMTALGQAVFSGCSNLESVELPQNLERIQFQAFGDCSSLSAITIPASVTEIGQYAFNNCRTLAYVVCEAITPPTVSSGSFSNTNNCPIYVPDNSVAAYKAANSWSTWASRIFPLSDKP